MIIDVSSVLKETGGKTAVEGTVELPDVELYGNSCKFSEPVSISGSISNNGKTLVLDADCGGAVTTRCARCAKEIRKDIAFHINEALVQGEKKTDEFEDIIVFEKNDVNIDEIVYNNFIINSPARYLCKDDCKGLCPKCGADLNEGECGCGEDDIDPRWAALAEMINKKDD